ncbi:Gfo/Idh/MocA family oxidoreductase [Halomonas sp. EGI 63088]|uniref:Gfo/Idh/MocA family oxidoreductase n=1 Tax=Halomonas flagellata TaxID=2920385 RepID=A0ABS9RWN9_9GAMM|nr:Gfo/Idh/MocA family oxidoreductase [Halomonas flagellata]MCH4564258.1 Gfo/Idh/MocA family oxidoreductase [Halomonas flagellata]
MKRFALIGAGFIGTLHARNLFRHPEVDFALVADVDPARAQALASQYGARAISVEKVFASDVDAVLIASSTPTHADYVERAARAGQAIYCEKPIDLDTRRAKRAVAAVREAGVAMMIGFNRRFDASHAALKDVVARGELGRVELVQMSCRSQDAPPLSYIEVSGGQMRDQTIHFFDLLCWLTEDVPVEVHVFGEALVDPRIGEAGDVDTSIATLRMASGALVQIDSTRRTRYGYDERVEVFGAQGMAESRRQPHRHLSVYKGREQVSDGLHADWLERIEPTFAAALDAFVAGLHGKDVDYPGAEAALRAQRIADAATRSLQTRAPVAIDVD